jgi:hypothetical protein
LTKWYYKALFKRYRIYIATLYLETSEVVRPAAKVSLIGAFT